MWCNGNIAALGAAAMGSIPIIPKKINLLFYLIKVGVAQW